MNIMPMVIEKTNNREYAYDLYSRMLKDRIVFCTGEIDDHKANLIISQLLYLDSLNHQDIALYINSGGGALTSGLAILDTMNFIKSDVKTICVGMAASMGAVLLCSGAPSKRSALAHSEIMIHQPLGGIQGQASDIKIAAERILKFKTIINQILATQTKQSITKINQDTERDYFMSAKEAQEYGLIDQII